MRPIWSYIGVLWLILLPFIHANNNGTDSSPCTEVETNPPSPAWVNDGGFLILIVAVVAMFWGLALVCEEYFVPALNVLCEEWKVPTDVAGATFMAAGASSPELFTGLIGLLIYHSNIGLGTVIGSQIFNHMIISAGSVLYAKGGVLKLDARIVMRDLVAYVCSMLFFLYTLMKDSEFGPSFNGIFDENTWNSCLSLTTAKSAELLIVYAIYATVCGNFQRLISIFCPRREEQAANDTNDEIVDDKLTHPHLYVTPAEIDALKSKPSQFKMQVTPEIQEKQEKSVAEAFYSAEVLNEVEDQPTTSPLHTTTPSEIELQAISSNHHDEEKGNAATGEKKKPKRNSRRGSRNSSSSNGAAGGIVNPSTTILDTLRLHQERNIEIEYLQRTILQKKKMKMSKKENPHDEKLQEMAAARRIRKKFIPQDEQFSIHDEDDESLDPESPHSQKGLLQRRPPSPRKAPSSPKKAPPSPQKSLLSPDQQPQQQQTQQLSLTDPDWWLSAAQFTWLWLLDAIPPSDVTTVEASEEFLACYLYLYTDVIGLDTLPAYFQWKLRFFTLDEYGLHSISQPHEGSTGSDHVEQCEIIDLVYATTVEITNPQLFQFRLLFEMKATAEGERTINNSIEFRAPSFGIMIMTIDRLKKMITQYRALPEDQRFAKAAAAQVHLWADTDRQKHIAHNLFALPNGRYARAWHYIVFPLKVGFHWTLVDCRLPVYRSLYGRMILICAIWLALLSYIMIICCNFIGSFINASPLVMGLTIAAVGTSFPNLISSMIVAKQGYGNMAICNALGSNVFNVNIALGLPYFLLLLIRGNRPYEDIANGGIVMQIFMLIAVSVIWIAMIIFEGFQMKAWMAWVFVVIYFVVMGVAIGL